MSGNPETTKPAWQESLIRALSRLSLRISNEQGSQSKFNVLEGEYAALAAQIVPVSAHARRVGLQETGEADAE